MIFSQLREFAKKFPDDKLTLEKLAEECAEVIQAKSKIIHFGLNDVYNNSVDKPDQTNREKLETEIGHLLACIDILSIRGIVREERMSQARNDKYAKIEKWQKYKEKERKHHDGIDF